MQDPSPIWMESACRCPTCGASFSPACTQDLTRRNQMVGWRLIWNQTTPRHFPCRWISTSGVVHLVSECILTFGRNPDVSFFSVSFIHLSEWTSTATLIVSFIFVDELWPHHWCFIHLCEFTVPWFLLCNFTYAVLCETSLLIIDLDIVKFILPSDELFHRINGWLFSYSL